MQIETVTSNKIEQLLHEYDRQFDHISFSELHDEAYEPIYYFMQAKGKRIRPILLMLAHDMFGGSTKDSLSPAFGIELFHSFTLIHDDIMDKAILRRGQPTVHKQFDEATAILAGDFLLILSFRYLARVKPTYLPQILKVYNQTATQIIEGQMMDAAFEKTLEVKVPDYLKMIEYKTAVLLATTVQIGGIIAGANDEEQDHLYQFGKNLGLAFQIKDDYLDAFGDQNLGKKIGGDIIRNKKTILFTKAWEMSGTAERRQLEELVRLKEEEIKIKETTHLYKRIGVVEEIEKMMDHYYQSAMACLEKIDLPGEKKSNLCQFASQIYQRIY